MWRKQRNGIAMPVWPREPCSRWFHAGMIVAPYKLRPTPPDLCLLTDGAGFLDEHGRILTAAQRPKGVHAWASLDQVNRLLRQGKGRALCWRGQPIRYALPSDPHGFHVRVLALPFPEDPDDAIAGLGRWRDWLASEGAAPQGSLGSTSMSLLRSTLEQELWTGVPFESCPPIRFTIGGRQELGPAGAPAEYRGQVRHFDIRAAYATMLGRLEYGGLWYRMRNPARIEGHAELLNRGGRMVFVRARVRLTGSAPGPLVRRPRVEPDTVFGFFPEYPTSGIIQGVWSYPEVAAAQEQGASVKLLEGWFHSSGADQAYPFRPWLHRIEQGRRMKGFPGVLAKATGNALWGQFCISAHGRKQVLFYDRAGRRHLIEVAVQGSRRPAHDLSEYLTGSVRAELYRFCAAAGSRLCSAHTDGGWADCTDGWSYPAWRLKETTSQLRVLDPQVLAYADSAGVERYVVAGWPSDDAEDRFESEWSERTRVAA